MTLVNLVLEFAQVALYAVELVGDRINVARSHADWRQDRATPDRQGEDK
jgi:hypothetical protein